MCRCCAKCGVDCGWHAWSRDTGSKRCVGHVATVPKPTPPPRPLLSPAALVRVRGLYERELRLWARAVLLAPHHVDAERMAAELEQDLAKQRRDYPELAEVPL